METAPKPSNIPAEDFFKFDIRAGFITHAEPVLKSKLLNLKVFFGPEIGEKIILAGIAKDFTPESLLGVQVVAVLNLEPREMKGIMSYGMLLAGRSATGQLVLVSPNGIAEGGEVG